jgi:hypothetical protein
VRFPLEVETVLHCIVVFVLHSVYGQLMDSTDIEHCPILLAFTVLMTCFSIGGGYKVVCMGRLFVVLLKYKPTRYMIHVCLLILVYYFRSCFCFLTC